MYLVDLGLSSGENVDLQGTVDVGMSEERAGMNVQAVAPWWLHSVVVKVYKINSKIVFI